MFLNAKPEYCKDNFSNVQLIMGHNALRTQLTFIYVILVLLMLLLSNGIIKDFSVIIP